MNYIENYINYQFNKRLFRIIIKMKVSTNFIYQKFIKKQLSGLFRSCSFLPLFFLFFQCQLWLFITNSIYQEK